MKKLVLLIVACLLLTACAQNIDSNQPTVSTPSSSTTTTSPTGFDNGLIDLLHLGDINSYKQFVQVADLPDDFVYYESLMVFGEFKSLVILSQQVDEYLAVDYTEYLYSFLDANGNELNLWVGNERSAQNPVDSKYQGDMREIGATGEKLTGSIFRNGVEYRYGSGKLSYISWESNGIPFTLGTEVEGDTFYPEDGPLTFVQELLHTDTNKAAMESFKTALEKPAVK